MDGVQSRQAAEHACIVLCDRDSEERTLGAWSEKVKLTVPCEFFFLQSKKTKVTTCLFFSLPLFFFVSLGSMAKVGGDWILELKRGESEMLVTFEKQMRVCMKSIIVSANLMFPRLVHERAPNSRLKSFVFNWRVGVDFFED
jgi:hypothetical protein